MEGNTDAKEDSLYFRLIIKSSLIQSMSQLLHHREKQNLTQQELAEMSGVSVRTIQRLEAGAPLKGHTLKTVAAALGVETSILQTAQAQVENVNIGVVKFINLCSLFFFIPLGNVIAPLLLAHFKKEKSEITRQLISLQIMWTIVSVVLILLTPFVQKWFSLNRQLILVIGMICILVNLFVIFRNAKEIDKTHSLRIKLNFNII